MPDNFETKAVPEQISRSEAKERKFFHLGNFIRGAILVIIAAIPACNGDDNNEPDGGDTDSDTPADCSNTEYEFGTFPAEKCFCPGDGDQVLEVEDGLLKGIKARFQEGTFDECVIATIGQANFTLGGDALEENDAGVVVDSNNPDGKILSKDGIEYKAMPTAKPYDLDSPTGYNEIQPNKEVSFEFPSWYGTVMKWMPDDKQFESVKPSVLDAEGTKYHTDSFSSYVVENTPFNSFTTSFVPGDVNGYDVNEDGVLVQIDVEDEGQTAFPAWVQLEVTDGTDYYELLPEGDTGMYRLPIFEGSHNLTFRVTDNNSVVDYTHSADTEKELDLDVLYTFEDSCDDNSGVIDGSACWVLANPLENCDTACDVLDSVANSIDGSCASGEWDDDDGSKCNALTGGAMVYNGGFGFAPYYLEPADRCYQRSDAYIYTLPDTVCNFVSTDSNYKRICKCEE